MKEKFSNLLLSIKDGECLPMTSNQIETNESLDHWKALNWTKIEKSVRRLQEKIFQASQRQEWKKVRNLQKLLVRSSGARLLAIRRFTQINSGKATPGIDGRVVLKNSERWVLYKKNDFRFNGYIPRPTRRIGIPKANGKGQRMLGIPTIHDRIMQALVKMALEAEWEAKFESNSFGFRPGRRTMDAIVQIHTTLVSQKKNSYILDADISKCFDTIDHNFLLNRVSTFREIIRKWLKIGVIECRTWKETPSGTPQGGVLSPLLANIVLDGMDRLFGSESPSGRYLNPSSRKGANKGISVVRYADDCVIIAPSSEIIRREVIPRLTRFLAERGLEFNRTKTRITHSRKGIHFLGFTIKLLQDKLLVFPQKDNVTSLLRRIKAILAKHKQVTVETLLFLINPVIRGWCGYYQHCNSKRTLRKVAWALWHMLYRWCCRRHPNKGKRWVLQKYFHKVGSYHFIFGASRTFTVVRPELMKIIRYTKVKGSNSPLDPALSEYWSFRRLRYSGISG